MQLILDRPWLIADLERPLRVLSWSLTHPGFVTAQRIVWREVRNADLPPELDAVKWFRHELKQVGQSDAVSFLTSRDVRRYTQQSATVEGCRADAVATVGLSNAECIGHRRTNTFAPGTINIAVRLSTPLTDGALVEAVSLAAQARTAAVMEHGPDLITGRATGTGTDCIAITAPSGDAAHAGMHTATGEALGRAVLDAVSQGVQEWMQDQGG